MACARCTALGITSDGHDIRGHARWCESAAGVQALLVVEAAVRVGEHAWAKHQLSSDPTAAGHAETKEGGDEAGEGNGGDDDRGRGTRVPWHLRRRVGCGG